MEAKSVHSQAERWKQRLTQPVFPQMDFHGSLHMIGHQSYARSIQETSNGRCTVICEKKGNPHAPLEEEACEKRRAFLLSK